MKYLLVATAVLEVATGVAMLAVPAMVVSLLLGATLGTPGGLAVARVTGAAVLAYNIMIVAVLVHAGVGLGLAGGGLWPAAGLHMALAIWCVASLR